MDKNSIHKQLLKQLKKFELDEVIDYLNEDLLEKYDVKNKNFLHSVYMITSKYNGVKIKAIKGQFSSEEQWGKEIKILSELVDLVEKIPTLSMKEKKIKVNESNPYLPSKNNYQEINELIRQVFMSDKTKIQLNIRINNIENEIESSNDKNQISKLENEVDDLHRKLREEKNKYDALKERYDKLKYHKVDSFSTERVLNKINNKNYRSNRNVKDDSDKNIEELKLQIEHHQKAIERLKKMVERLIQD